ncbi:MAG: hypothetical protein KDB21_19175 [Acidimicrobiales bacterium]|nr:hypothetical protein [Acidimicrobiales bacterium]
MVLVCLASASLASAQDVRTARVPDGEWYGTVIYVTSVNAGDAGSEGAASGTFLMTVASGLPSGSFVVEAVGVGITPDSSAELEIVISGNVAGTADQPLLDSTSASVNGRARTQGIEVPVAFELGAGELDPFELDVRAASCELVSGDLQTQTFQSGEMLAAAGGAFTGSGFWVATADPAGADSDLSQQMSDLIADAEHLAQGVEAGVFNGPALRYVTLRAEQLMLSLPRNTACQSAGLTEFSTAIGAVVSRILDLVIANRDQVDIHELLDAIIAGVAAGVIGPSSGDAGLPQTQLLTDLLIDHYQIAVAGSDPETLMLVHFAAGILGAQNLAADALAAATDAA